MASLAGSALPSAKAAQVQGGRHMSVISKCVYVCVSGLEERVAWFSSGKEGTFFFFFERATKEIK